MKDVNKVYWNEQFKILQDTWPKPTDFNKCIEICLKLHAMVHTSQVAPSDYSFEDELWNRFDEKIFRTVYKEDQSIAWKLWHLARIEDMTMNVLVAGGQQLFLTENWQEKLGVNPIDTGNAMNEAEIAELSNSMNFESLKAYRDTVGKRTREIIASLKPENLKRKVKVVELQRLADEGAVVPEAKGLLDYWGKKTVSGLLLMPATRHIMVHLNEAFRIVQWKE